MAQHLTCPHCETDLNIKDEVTASVSCPQCQALIPHGGTEGSIVQTCDAEAMEGMAQRRDRGARVVGLITLVCVPVCFGIGALLRRLEGLNGTPYMPVVLLQVALMVFSPGCALLVFCWTTAAMTRFLTDALIAEEPPIWNGLITIVAVLAGVVAGALALSLTAGAILGGALVVV